MKRFSPGLASFIRQYACHIVYKLEGVGHALGAKKC